MTERFNININKNSKIFQDFLLKKNLSKNNESTIQNSSSFNKIEQKKQNQIKHANQQIDSFDEKTTYEEKRQTEPVITYQKGIFQVKIDQNQHSEVPPWKEDFINSEYQCKRQPVKNSPKRYNETSSLQKMPTFSEIPQQEYDKKIMNKQNNVQIQPKRQRRDRQFTGKMHEKRQINQNLQKQLSLSPYGNRYPMKSVIANANNSNKKSKDSSPQQENYSKQKKDIRKMKYLNNEEDLNSNSIDERRKYERLYQKYQEIKCQTQKENKERKKERSEWEEEIELLKEKLYEVQSREDILVIENQRLKDKNQTEGLHKKKLEEENTQLNHKIQEIEDMLSGKEGNIKKRTDEILYWKSQAEVLKKDVHSLELSCEKLEDQCKMLQGQNSMLRKERENKDLLIEELRKNIPSLVQENNMVKDHVYALTTRLFHMEQENQVLKADLKREKEPFSMGYLQDKIHYPEHQNKMQYPEHQNKMQYPEHQTHTRLDEHEGIVQPPRRRGEFAKQRAINQKPDKLQKQRDRIRSENINTNQEQKSSALNNTSMLSNSRHANERSTRMKEIEEQLQRMKDMKAMTGAMKRKKIMLEREIEELTKN